MNRNERSREATSLVLAMVAGIVFGFAPMAMAQAPNQVKVKPSYSHAEVIGNSFGAEMRALKNLTDRITEYQLRRKAEAQRDMKQAQEIDRQLAKGKKIKEDKIIKAIDELSLSCEKLKAKELGVKVKLLKELYFKTIERELPKPEKPKEPKK